ncbi:MAG TPA: HD domain-containing protein [Gaiellaceae bacterium]|jgi:putative nucleotidyltransferase with HDIG domain
MVQVETGKLEALKEGVRASLPEVAMIKDEALREQVVELHAQALAETSYERIEDIPASGVPESPLMTRGTQADHYRGVATMAAGMAKGLEDVMGGLEIDYDLLIAAALVHDVGKAYEFAGWERWKRERSRTGSPALRHPVYGAHLALQLGMPEEIVHCIAAHPYMGEGQFVKASVETTIVQYADVAFWKVLEAGGHLEDEMDITGIRKS